MGLGLGSVTEKTEEHDDFVWNINNGVARKIYPAINQSTSSFINLVGR